MEEQIARAKARIKELQTLVEHWEKKKWIVGIVALNLFGVVIQIVHLYQELYPEVFASNFSFQAWFQA